MQNLFWRKKRKLSSVAKKEKKGRKEDIKIKMENIRNLKIFSPKMMKINHNARVIRDDKTKNQDTYKTMSKD